MVITKTIREYVERVANDKINRKLDEIRQKDETILRKIQPQIDKINEDARLKCRKVLEKEGLNPDDYGYGDTNCYSPILLPRNRGRYIHFRNRNDIIGDILLKIELDEIPKKEVKAFVDDYDIDIEDHKLTRI